MAKKRVTERLWKAIAPLLPEHRPSPKGGRPPVPDRACLEGIIFVLMTGMPWQMLPTELGYGSGSTCWRRFRDWTRLEVWPRLHQGLLRVLGRRGRINLERAVIDSASVRALKGGAHTGPNPTDRGERGCKRHIVTDADGIPLVVRTGPANQPGAELELEMLDAIPPAPAERVDRGADPRRSKVTALTASRRSSPRSCSGGFVPCWRRMARRASSTAAAWVRPAMSSNGRSVGWATSDDSSCATNASASTSRPFTN